MAKSKVIILTGLITALFLISATQAWAATIKLRMVLFHTKVEIIKVGDVEGHIIGLHDTTGLASLETGEVAVVSERGTFDYTKGTGIHRGYERLTFEDGSTIDLKYEGTTRPESKGKGSLLKGTSLVITQGSGGYAGIQGEGSYTGRRVVAAGAGAQLFADMILKYTLP